MGAVPTITVIRDGQPFVINASDRLPEDRTPEELQAAEAAKATKAAAEKQASRVAELGKLTVPELRKLAEERKVTLPEEAPKTDIVAAILTAEAAG